MGYQGLWGSCGGGARGSGPCPGAREQCICDSRGCRATEAAAARSARPGVRGRSGRSYSVSSGLPSRTPCELRTSTARASGRADDLGRRQAALTLEGRPGPHSRHLPFESQQACVLCPCRVVGVGLTLTGCGQGGPGLQVARWDSGRWAGLRTASGCGRAQQDVTGRDT